MTGVGIAGLVSTPAHAGDSAPVAPPVSTTTEPRLSENTALAASVGGTLVSWTLVITAGSMIGSRRGETALSSGLLATGAIGTFLAPSAGHWYAGTAVTRGLGLRALGAGSALLGFAATLDCEPNQPCDGSPIFVGGLLLGAALYLGGTIDDIRQAPRRVRGINTQRGSAVLPRVTNDSIGLAFGGTF